MIGYLKGNLIYIKDKETCLLAGGVGYQLEVPERILSRLEVGQEAAFWVETVVREDSFKLYGFLSPQEKHFFNLLVTVNGVGPKAALNLLSVIEPSELARAIMHEDIAKISTVPGVGKKTAERITLELKEKVLKTLPPSEVEGETPEITQVLEFLLSLGAGRAEADQALKAARQSNPQAGFEELLSLSLKGLQKV